MDKNKLIEIENGVRSASPTPLDLVAKLQEAELYDKKETQTVVDEVYQEFSKQGSLVDEVVVPVFMSIAEGLLESTPATRKLKKKGLTASRIINECRTFSYGKVEPFAILPDGYTEYKNISEQTRSDFEDHAKNGRGSYDRENLEDKKRMNKYKKEKFNNNGGRINATDEYTGQKNVYQYRNKPDARRNIEKYKHDHQAEIDHIVPLKQIHEQLKGNYAISDEDVKNIANNDTNLALTSARINRGAGVPGAGSKFDKTNAEFVEDQRRREKEGEPNLGLSEKAKENMLKMGKETQTSINKDANKAIFDNIIGQGTADTSKIWSKTAGNAANQSKDYAVGNVILFLIKPLYYEVSDIFRNGLKEGVDVDSTKQAFKIRFGRIKQYVMDNVLTFLGDNIWEFVKGFLSSLIEGIISLFVGILRQMLKVVKEGIKILVKSGKVLFGKDSKHMSTAEKGDAIIKLIGGSVITLCGIGIETLLNRIGVMEPWSIILSTMLSGIASTLFMLILDKIDLFSVKAEKRRKRIEEIFEERINDIREAVQKFNLAAIETIHSYRLQFMDIENNINKAIQANDITTMNSGLSELASFMNVLGYNNLDEFTKNFDDLKVVL